MNLSALSIEEREKLKEYLNSVQEIQSEINLMLEKAGCRLKESSDEKHNRSSNLTYTFSGNSTEDSNTSPRVTNKSPKVTNKSPEDGF
jgi:hypothetical protein